MSKQNEQNVELVDKPWFGVYLNQARMNAFTVVKAVVGELLDHGVILPACCRCSANVGGGLKKNLPGSDVFAEGI